MPIEHINYTITAINNKLWAKIDGNYPIYANQTNNPLPIVYPMPPNATNIHLYIDDTELDWYNYTQVYPQQLHKTAIGNWWMVFTVLENISETFVLKIHYEHPIEKVNERFLFLYDLNIREYLSAENPQSTAYFTITFDTNITDMQVYTAPPDSTPNQWQPKTYLTKNEDTQNIIKIEMHSTHNTELPGDLVLIFSSHQTPNNIDTQPHWLIALLLITILAIVLYIKRKTITSTFSSKHRQNNQFISPQPYDHYIIF